MELDSADSSNLPTPKVPEVQPSVATGSGPDNAPSDAPSRLSSWAKNLKIPQSFAGGQDESPTGNTAKSTFARFTSGIGLRLSPKTPTSEDSPDGSSTTAQPGLFGTFTKGIVDSSRNAVKAVQVKARHVVSQNKRRYQEGGFDLDMTYITENIIAMGFPAGDMSSGFFGYVEGFYRNHMEEVIKFFETHHKDKYKVYNLCSERLYDASLFEGKDQKVIDAGTSKHMERSSCFCNLTLGNIDDAYFGYWLADDAAKGTSAAQLQQQVASFPFDDHNCPPIQLITLFCQSAYSWLKEDIENVVVVHCKAGMARTGLMISSLLLFLKFFPTAEESIDYYNQKRCFDGKGLVLPSQIRYVKYFERILTYFNGENQPGRRCMLRGFRLHRCPYWIRPSITVSDHNGVLFSTKKHPRTKDMSPEEFWFSAPKKGIMVFALPGEPGLTPLAGDFKIHFHDRQGDFYCWLNTTMMENRKILNPDDLDGFDKRKLPSPGFQVEVVLIDHDGSVPSTPKTETDIKKSDEISGTGSASVDGADTAPNPGKDPGSKDKDDVFSDGEVEESGSSKSRQAQVVEGSVAAKTSSSETKTSSDQIASITHKTEQVSLGTSGTTQIHDASKPKSDTVGGVALGLEPPNPERVSEFKAMAADASVFTFGDDDDYESE